MVEQVVIEILRATSPREKYANRFEVVPAGRQPTRTRDRATAGGNSKYVARNQAKSQK